MTRRDPWVRWHRTATADQARHLAQIRAAHPHVINMPAATPPVAVSSPPPPPLLTADSIGGGGHSGHLRTWVPAATIPPPTPAPTRSGAGGGVVYTAPHYIRVPAPTHARLTTAMTGGSGLLGRLRAVFKALVILGFVYACAIACIATAISTHLDTNTTESEVITHDPRHGPR